jgi:hypothetical protein
MKLISYAQFALCHWIQSHLCRSYHFLKTL